MSARQMKTRMILTLVAMVSFALIASNASAASIGLNFRNGSGGRSVATSAGVVPQTNWNNSDGALTGDTSANAADIVGSQILDSNGTDLLPGGLDIAWGGALNAWSTNNTGNGDEDLMRDYLDNGNEWVTFTGLPAAYTSAGYDVYVYFGAESGDGDRTGKYSDGTMTYSYGVFSHSKSFPTQYTLTTDTGSGYPNANYAIFSGLTAASFTITQTYQNGNNGMHGIQVVQVPEPATMALLGLGGLGLLLGRKRR